MKWPRFDNRFLTAVEILALLATAAFAPWWGTIVVVALLRLLFLTSVRDLSVFTFCSWIAVCVFRDFENLHGPSRIFAKLFSLSRLGITLDSGASRLIVYTSIGLVGFALAVLSAAGVAAVQQMFTHPRSTV